MQCLSQHCPWQLKPWSKKNMTSESVWLGRIRIAMTLRLTPNWQGS
jgi:hypothetical protein